MDACGITPHSLDGKSWLCVTFLEVRGSFSRERERSGKVIAQSFGPVFRSCPGGLEQMQTVGLRAEAPPFVDADAAVAYFARQLSLTND